MLTRTTALLTALALAGPAAADDPKKPTNPTAAEVEKAQKRLTEYLGKLPGGAAARATALTQDGVGATFPDHVLFSVVFPQYPIARLAPEPLKSANVITVPKGDGKLIPATSTKEMQALFKDHARPIGKSADVEETTRAWLWASAELSQDGFFEFTVQLDEKTATDGKGFYRTGGAAVVVPKGGNKGELRATLTFKDGKLDAVEEKRRVIAGVRPICQATKLLDPDPIVRGMAEQAIRVMGSAAKPYLDEQRAKASPELQAAIDRVWQQIVAEGR
jgi:hypothetical protein